MHGGILMIGGGARAVQDRYPKITQRKHYWALMFAAFITGHHLAISAACISPSASGVSFSGGNNSWPSSRSRFCTVGSPSAFLIAPLSFKTTSRGVFLGAQNPRKFEM